MSNKAVADGVNVGTLVAGTYEIISILGRGGMGTVWEAHHQRLPGKRVAIKVLHPSVADDADALARFRREAEIACRLGHPNIVEVHDFNSLADGTPYLILELLEGQSLDARLREGQLSLDLCEVILRQVASALQCAHEQGVVHRDLKPQNIFLVPSPTGVGPEIAKVLDFGISKIRGSQTVKTQESTLLGTPQYMAPEQATGQHDNVDARTDLFALAVMLYELLSGRAAFAGQNIPEVVYKVVHVDPEPITSYLPGLPAAKVAALHKAMSKSQDDRFASVADFVQAFTGTPLAPTRIRTTPAPADISEDSTIASNKLAVGSAATMDSQKRSTPVPTDISKLASAATIDSQKVARDQALAATIDSSKIERQSTLMAAQPAQPLGTQADAAIVATPRTVPLRTLLLGVGVIACIAAALWVITSDSSKERASDTQVLAAGTTDSAPVMDASVPIALVASSEDAAMATGTDEADAAMPSSDATPASSPDQQSKSVTPKRKRPKDPPEEEAEEVAANDPKRAVAKAHIARARKLLASGDNDGAVAAADQALKAFVQPQTYEIKVMVSCNKSDLTNANAAMRNVPKRPRALRKKLQLYCKERGTNLDI